MSDQFICTTQIAGGGRAVVVSKAVPVSNQAVKTATIPPKSEVETDVNLGPDLIVLAISSTAPVTVYAGEDEDFDEFHVDRLNPVLWIKGVHAGECPLTQAVTKLLIQNESNATAEVSILSGSAPESEAAETAPDASPELGTETES